MRLVVQALLAPLLLASAASAPARDLPVPAIRGWQHAATGLILLPTLDGLPRTKLGDLTQTEHDVYAEFAAPDASAVVTVYLFHPAVDDVAMWFERSEAALYDRATYGDVSPASADPVAFAPPGGGAPGSALRRVYTPAKGGYRATGLAVMPLGDWLVAIRISSRSEGTAALDTRLSRVIAGLRWPAGVAPAAAATPIPACATPLAVDGKAKRTKPGGTGLLMSLLGSAVAADRAAKGEKPKPVRWCRDPAAAPTYGVYRNTASDRGYTLALQDAGRVVHIVPSFEAQTGKGSDYTMSLTDVDGSTTSFPGFDRLPAPDQVVKALAGPRLGSAQGNKMTIDAGAL